MLMKLERDIQLDVITFGLLDLLLLFNICIGNLDEQLEGMLTRSEGREDWEWNMVHFLKKLKDIIQKTGNISLQIDSLMCDTLCYIWVSFICETDFYAHPLWVIVKNLLTNHA